MRVAIWNKPQHKLAYYFTDSDYRIIPCRTKVLAKKIIASTGMNQRLIVDNKFTSQLKQNVIHNNRNTFNNIDRELWIYEGVLASVSGGRGWD